MSTPRVITVLIVLAVLGYVGYLYYAGAYGRYALEELSKEIIRVEFRPHVDRELVVVSDAAAIREIRDWLLSAEAPPLIASLPPTTCPLTVYFEDGSSTQLSISPTGKMRTYIKELPFQDSEALIAPSSAILEWNGHIRVGTNQPLTRFLRTTGQLDSAEPNPVSMYSSDPDH